MLNENEKTLLHFIANKIIQEKLMYKVDNVENPLQQTPTSQEMFFLRMAIETIAGIEDVNKKLMLQLLENGENLRELLKFTNHHTIFLDKEKGLILLPGSKEDNIHKDLDFYKYFGQMDILEALDGFIDEHRINDKGEIVPKFKVVKNNH